MNFESRSKIASPQYLVHPTIDQELRSGIFGNRKSKNRSESRVCNYATRTVPNWALGNLVIPSSAPLEVVQKDI
jgi:hypothetical protein